MKPVIIDLDYFRSRSSVNANGCWIWNGCKAANGYGSMRSRGRNMRPHRAVYELLRGPQGNLCICHTCDTPACCNPDHLFAGTRKDNIRDCMTKGRFKRPGNYKLTAAQVTAIKADTRKQKIIAAEYGVLPCTISRLKSGKSWVAA